MMQSGSKAPMTPWSRCKEMFGFDKRSMALYRIALALCVIGDLIERASDLKAFYTDGGIVPRSLVAEKYFNVYSLNFHAVSGTFTYQAAIFLFNGFLALCLLIGYRTRLMTFSCWLLLVSLQSHNPFINHGGDLYFRLLLFYGIFLPLGSCYSVDSALKTCEKPRRKLTSNRYLSAATFAFIVQISTMYISSVRHKSAAEWTTDHTATWWALQLDYFRTDIGGFFLQFPGMLKLLTWAVLNWEFYGAFFLFIPFWTDQFRLLGALGYFAMHLGFVLCMRLGLFFYVCATGTFILIPPIAWDFVLGKLRTAERKSFSIYYHERSAFSKKVAYLLHQFLLVPGTSISSMHNLFESGVFTELYTSKVDELWLVAEDVHGTRYKNEKALQAIFSHSPLVFPLARITSLFTLPGSIISFFHADSLATSPDLPDKEDGAARPRAYIQRRKILGPRFKRATRIASTVALLFLVAYVISWNMSNHGSQYGFPTSMSFIGRFLHIDQSWGMFSPHPPKNHWWYVIWAETDTGEVFELFRNAGLFTWQGNTPYSLEKPDPFHESFKNHRWFKFFEVGYNNKNRQDLRLSFGKYICRQYNAVHFGNDRLYHFKVNFVIETQTLEGPRNNRRSESLWEHICYDKPKTEAKAA